MNSIRRPLALVLACVVTCSAVSASAQEVSSPTEPIFKRVKPPAPGTTRRITVQLTELPQPPAPLPPVNRSPTPDAPVLVPGAGMDWYWAAVSPSLSAAGPARVSRALQMLDSAPEGAGISAPRLQTMQSIADAHGVDILTATIGTRVSPALVLAMISVESSGRTAAVSSAGATGLMQLMPATAERFGVADRTHPGENIRGGVAYMDWLLREFGGDAVLALAGYNAGENAVKSHDGVPPYAETRAYVPKVLAAWTVARGLCLTPPDLMSDPCVFVGRRAASNG